MTLAPAPEPEPEVAPTPLPPLPASPRLARLRVLLVMMCLLIVGVLAALTAYYAASQRRQAVALAEQRVENVARALEERLARTFGEANAALGALQESIEQRGGLLIAGENESLRLTRRQQAALAAARAVITLDQSGKLFSDSREVSAPALFLGDRDFFRAQQAGDSRLVVGRSLRDHADGRWVIPVSRRIAGVGGSFGGVVAAFIDPAHFENLLRDYDAAAGTTMLVTHTSGRSLLHYPGDNRDLDQDVAAAPGGDQADALSGAATGAGADGVARISASRRLADYPVIVSAALPVEAALATWRQSTLVAALGASVLALIVVIVLMMLYSELRRRLKAEATLRHAHEQLEQRIRERSTTLEQANRQLAAFSYSVSHDLRTPLRAINGFCQALEEDYGHRLDANGRSHLQRVRRASERMGELIDGIVELTSLSRADVHRTRTNLSEIAEEIVLEMAEAEPSRKAYFDIAPDVWASADYKLVRVMLTQLFSNAWKFTRSSAETRISFGAVDEGGETVFFVDDNGVGFDMTHAAKLFSPFQRLHGPGEFEGFGIGLATVKHVADLHGGRVWADAVPGQGAVVYFTLAPRHAASNLKEFPRR